MPRLNREGREIWFERYWGGYVPCHWKGWAMVGAIAIPGFLAMKLLSWVARAFFPTGLETVVTAILFAPLMWLGFRVLGKHIPTRD